MFGNNKTAELEELRGRVATLQADNTELRGWVTQLRGEPAPALEADLRQLSEIVASRRAMLTELTAEVQAAAGELAAVRSELVETREVVLLQQVGIYDYRHPLEDAAAYKDALSALRADIKKAAADDAVSCQVTWAVNGSQREGEKMGRDIAKLMLRAYNAEADNAVRTLKPHALDAAIAKLAKSRDAIAKLGVSMRIVISPAYHALRAKELELTADFLVKQEQEKERTRAERERLREEEKARREIERAKAKLAKERSHYANVLSRLETAGGDQAAIAEAQAQLASIDEAIAGVEAREANTRAGYVYVISNMGSFGPDIVKIGMTRRLEPMDRIRELGDASVPFRFDVHALIFSEDAVGLETLLHQQFAPAKVNLVNFHREFFYATPAQVQEALLRIGGQQVLEFTEVAEALEFRASDPARRGFDLPDEHASLTGPLTHPLAEEAAEGGFQTGHSDVGYDGDLSDDGLEAVGR
jgi:hypothetical protein